MASRIWIWALILPLMLTPHTAGSQCCMMPAGSGDHVRMGGETSSERKVKKDIDRLLSSERSRALLMEALLQDRDFTEAFIERIAEYPEWRAMAQKRLTAPPGDMGQMSEDRMPDRKPAPSQEEERRFRVAVDGEGFHPASLTIPAGKPVTLVVTRTSDNTCAKEIVIPALNETRSLPLDRPVEIRIPPQASGTLTFACGMNMYRGRLVVR